MLEANKWNASRLDIYEGEEKRFHDIICITYIKLEGGLTNNHKRRTIGLYYQIIDNKQSYASRLDIYEGEEKRFHDIICITYIKLEGGLTTNHKRRTIGLYYQIIDNKQSYLNLNHDDYTMHWIFIFLNMDEG